MRTKGASTKKLCFNLIVNNNEGQELFKGDFITLRDIGDHLGFSYNQVVEIARKRRKTKKGRYENNYLITNIGKNNLLEEEVKDECFNDNGNVIDEFLLESK